MIRYEGKKLLCLKQLLFINKHICRWLNIGAARRNFFGKELEKNGMRRAKNKGIAKKAAVILLVFLMAGTGLFVWVQSRPKMPGYSEESISIAEIKEELSFGVYEKADWDAFFSPYHKAYLTGEILSQLLTELGVADYIEMAEMSGRHVVEREEWNAIYGQILDYLDMEHAVTTENLLILDVIEAEDGYILVTNLGDYTTQLPEDSFLQWQGYKVYCTAERCIGISGVSKDELSVRNAYLTEYSEEGIQFLYGGAVYQKEIGVLGASPEAGICDIVIKAGDICALRMKQDTIKGELLSYDDTMIEIAGYGKVSHPGRIPVYQTYGTVIEKSLSDVVLGNMEVTYVTGENQVCAILIGQPADIQDIRVLLLSDGGTNYREQVYLKSDVDAQVSCGERKEQLAAGTLLVAEHYLADMPAGTLTVVPNTAEGNVFICDAEGNVISNGYQGVMEVRSYEEGYTLVNDVPFETYLCAVVPSEMPSTYQPEALKAQAVCARSYAYIQLLRADLAAYGAHINDSTSYQVYNKVAATDASRQAVFETMGQMLLYKGNPVEAYYFSTSMGYTDTAEIWNIEDESSYGYLKSVCLNKGEDAVDLSEEGTFLSYISQPAEGYDSDIKYYRWFAAADYRDKTEAVNEILISRNAIAPRNVRFFHAGKTDEMEEVNAETVAKLGKITGIKVDERSPAGSILTLCIQYEKGSAFIKNEYNIRKVLGVCVDKMIYADSSESTSVTMLPSAFCAITEQEDGTVLLQGGGYGHGLGMSQNAANGMAKAGMNYTEILQYFYQDITISSVE